MLRAMSDFVSRTEQVYNIILRDGSDSSLEQTF